MKRILFAFSLLLSTIFALQLMVHAESLSAADGNVENHVSTLNSDNVDADVLEALEPGSSAKVVKVYNLPVVYAFTDYNTIEDVLTSEHVLSEFHAVLFAENDVMLYTNLGLHTTENSIFHEKAVVAYFDESIIKTVSQDIKVYNAYFLSGATNHQGTAIYYETNLGDYVYYYNGGEYLMPSSAFVNYMRTLYEHMLTIGMNGAGGNVANSLSIYALHSDNYNPNYLPAHLDSSVHTKNLGGHWLGIIPIAIGVLIVAGAGGFLWWRRKKNNGN